MLRGWLVAALLCAPTLPAAAEALARAQAAALRANYAAAQIPSVGNPFHRPLTLRSSEGRGTVSGDIHALLETPFDTSAAALTRAIDWCGILILHINTKACQVSADTRGKVLDLWIGAKEFQPLADASRLSLAFRVIASTPEYLRIGLAAADGPLDTRDYLAIESYLGALSVPPEARFEKRIRDWYAATEAFPRQLREVGEAEYLEMKRRQNRRPVTPPA